MELESNWIQTSQSPGGAVAFAFASLSYERVDPITGRWLRGSLTVVGLARGRGGSRYASRRVEGGGWTSLAVESMVVDAGSAC